MRPIGRSRGLWISLLFLMLAALPARAAGLTSADYRYLANEFGFARDGFTLANIAPGDSARLNEVINDPVSSSAASVRKLNVAPILLQIERATCERWQLQHGGASCPDVADQRFAPGWAVAERRCIACHLTGTTEAPSFYSLAKSRMVTEQFLASALMGEHAMSPITLSPGEMRDLALYINSLPQAAAHK